jgi:hypothetical protein
MRDWQSQSTWIGIWGVDAEFGSASCTWDGVKVVWLGKQATAVEEWGPGLGGTTTDGHSARLD